MNRPNPVGDSINPVLFAREHGFELFTRGLGALPTTTDVFAYTPDKYDRYWDPEGFEPGDDEPAPWSTPAKAALFLGASALVAVVVARVLS